MWDDPPMARLGINQYGKAQTHLVRVTVAVDADKVCLRLSVLVGA